MDSYVLGYGGRWRETFDDPDAAVRAAEAMAEAGLVVEVVRKRFGFHSFFTAFPESEREALRARWRVLSVWGLGGTGGSISHHHHHAYNSIGRFPRVYHHGGGHHGY